jgi:hypothetical protein
MIKIHGEITLDLIFGPSDYKDDGWDSIIDDMPELFQFHTYSVIPVNLNNNPLCGD